MLALCLTIVSFRVCWRHSVIDVSIHLWLGFDRVVDGAIRFR
jgi:hypothetical protein